MQTTYHKEPQRPSKCHHPWILLIPLLSKSLAWRLTAFAGKVVFNDCWNSENALVISLLCLSCGLVPPLGTYCTILWHGRILISTEKNTGAIRISDVNSANTAVELIRSWPDVSPTELHEELNVHRVWMFDPAHNTSLPDSCHAWLRQKTFRNRHGDYLPEDVSLKSKGKNMKSPVTSDWLQWSSSDVERQCDPVWPCTCDKYHVSQAERAELHHLARWLLWSHLFLLF